MIDRLSDTWLTVEELVKNRLKVQRHALETTRDAIIAAETRGEVRALKAILEAAPSPAASQPEHKPHRATPDPSGY